MFRPGFTLPLFYPYPYPYTYPYPYPNLPKLVKKRAKEQSDRAAARESKAKDEEKGGDGGTPDKSKITLGAGNEESKGKGSDDNDVASPVTSPVGTEL